MADKIYTLAEGQHAIYPGDKLVISADGFARKYIPPQKLTGEDLVKDIEARRMPYKLKGEYPYFYDIDVSDTEALWESVIDDLLSIFWKEDNDFEYDPDILGFKGKQEYLYKYIEVYNYRDYPSLKNLLLTRKPSKQIWV